MLGNLTVHGAGTGAIERLDASTAADVVQRARPWGAIERLTLGSTDRILAMGGKAAMTPAVSSSGEATDARNTHTSTVEVEWEETEE